MIDPKKYQPQTGAKARDFVTFDVVSVFNKFERISGVENYKKLAEILTEMFDAEKASLATSFAMQVWSIESDSEVFPVGSSDVVVVAHKHEDAYKEAIQGSQLERKECHERFYRDCCEWIGVKPERHVNRKIFDQAWDKRHSEGYDAVFDEFDELHDFFIDALDLIGVDYEF